MASVGFVFTTVFLVSYGFVKTVLLDFSPSTAIFAKAKFGQRKFFLRHPLNFHICFENFLIGKCCKNEMIQSLHMQKPPKFFWHHKHSQCQIFHGGPLLLGYLKSGTTKKGQKQHILAFLDIQGGSGGSKKMWTSKYSGSRVIVAKIADIGPPGAPQYFFQKKNLERSNYCSPRHIYSTYICLGVQ